jgi:hypothetical protein
VKHSTLEINEIGFKHDKIQYKNLQEVVRDLKSVLIVPLSRVCLPEYVPSSVNNSRYGVMPNSYTAPLVVLAEQG